MRISTNNIYTVKEWAAPCRNQPSAQMPMCWCQRSNPLWSVGKDGNSTQKKWLFSKGPVKTLFSASYGPILLHLQPHVLFHVRISSYVRTRWCCYERTPFLTVRRPFSISWSRDSHNVANEIGAARLFHCWAHWKDLSIVVRRTSGASLLDFFEAFSCM